MRFDGCDLWAVHKTVRNHVRCQKCENQLGCFISSPVISLGITVHFKIKKKKSYSEHLFFFTFPNYHQTVWTDDTSGKRSAAKENDK